MKYDINTDDFTLAQLGRFGDHLQAGLDPRAAAALAFLPDAHQMSRGDVEDIPLDDIRLTMDQPANPDATVIDRSRFTIKQHQMIVDLVKRRNVGRLVAEVYVYLGGTKSLAECKALRQVDFDVVDGDLSPAVTADQSVDPSGDIDIDTPTSAR